MILKDSKLLGIISQIDDKAQPIYWINRQINSGLK